MSRPIVMKNDRPTLLQVNELHKCFERRPGVFGGGRDRLPAVSGVDFSLDRGEVLGLAGESGSGKSTLARILCQLLTPDRGEVLLDGAALRKMDRPQRMEARRRVQMIFQDPSAALSPRRTIAQTLLEPQHHFGLGPPSERKQNAVAALASVGLDASALDRFPHQFSSGQRQRISIARALLAQPDLLVADEAVSALDVSVQAQILQLLSQQQREKGIAILFISHDLAVIRQLADRVGIMFQGRLVEMGPAAGVFERPAHPYTRQLLSVITDPTPRSAAPELPISKISGPPSPGSQTGCPFEARCPISRPECHQQRPEDRVLSDSPGHVVKCLLADSMNQGHATLADHRTN